MLAVTGLNSTIVQAVSTLCGERFVHRIESDTDVPIPDCQRYLLAAGVLVGKRVNLQTNAELLETAWVNLLRPLRLVETILDRQDDARICVIGSMSALTGSYDAAYAATKAGLHQYVLTRATSHRQQLFCVAPRIISDAGMTLRRADFPEVLAKRRTVTTAHVAEVIVRHLFDTQPYPLTNAVVEVL